MLAIIGRLVYCILNSWAVCPKDCLERLKSWNWHYLSHGRVGWTGHGFVMLSFEIPTLRWICFHHHWHHRQLVRCIFIFDFCYQYSYQKRDLFHWAFLCVQLHRSLLSAISKSNCTFSPQFLWFRAYSWFSSPSFFWTGSF